MLKKNTTDKIFKVVFVRHGESTWNKENRFTGWTDVSLTENGVKEAVHAGQLLKQNNYQFDIAHTSVLTRAIMTYNTIATELGCHYIPVYKHWRLNERHYGALQGLNKAETAAKHGDEQVKIWRRSFDVPPPVLEAGSTYDLGADPRYAGIAIPQTESLKLTIERVLPYWESAIAPQLAAGETVIIAAHGNSLRALVKHLSAIPDDEITELEIPTGQPIVYEFDAAMQAGEPYYLKDG